MIKQQLLEDFEILSKRVQDAIDEIYIFEDKYGNSNSRYDLLKFADYIDEVMSQIEMDITEEE